MSEKVSKFELAKYIVGIIISAIAVFYAVKERVALVESKVHAQEIRIEKVETKCDQITAIQKDIEYIRISQKKVERKLGI